MSNIVQLEPVPFHGDTLWAVQGSPDELVAIKPICVDLRLNWSGQLQRIKRDTILSQFTRVIHIPSPGGMQETVCMRRGYVSGWLFGIDDKRIKDPAIREKVLTYKRECHEVLYKHFFGGRYGNPEPTDAPALDTSIPLGTHKFQAELTLIRECRRLYGVGPARALWPGLGLPMVPEMYGDTAQIVGGRSDASGVEEFLRECCEEIPGARTRTVDLWQAYDTWCRANNRVPTSLCMFGRALSARFRRLKSGVSWYIGIAVKAA